MGVWDVAALADAMPAEQYRSWLAYAEIEPFGEIQADLRAGAIARVVAEPNRDRDAHSAPFTVLDFIPWIMTEERLAEKDAERELTLASPEEQAAIAERRAMVLAGIDPDEIETMIEAEG